MAGLPFSSRNTSIPWPCLELLYQTTEGHQTHKFAQIPFLVNEPLKRHLEQTVKLPKNTKREHKARDLYYVI